MSREDNIYYARLAEQGERYEDMIRYMKQVSFVNNNTHTYSQPKFTLHLTLHIEAERLLNCIMILIKYG